MVEVELCEGMLDEIIARLPPKFILQFRCVSKSWCSHINHSNFIRRQAIHSAARARRTLNVAHQLHIQKDACKMLHKLKPEGPFLELDSLKFSGGYNAFNYCYGIICLYNKTNITSITLWNPSIKRKLNVPNVPYDPCQEFSVVFGFGYDAVADDYNIVGLSYGTLQTLFLYSTKTNAWREIDLPKAYPPFNVLSSSGGFVDGAMHWAVKNDSPNTKDFYIITFDLSSRVFGTIDPKIGIRCRILIRIILCPGHRVMSSSNSCVKYKIDNYVETLALLDNENCSINKEPDCGGSRPTG